jgi:UrcA family protein
MNPRVTAKLVRRAGILMGLVLCNALAMAGTEASVATRVVSYADLDLSSVQGVTALYRRITRAADRVCDPVEALGHNECVARAVAEAVRTAHRPELAAYYEGKGRHPRLKP